jgi:hypothetical protein
VLWLAILIGVQQVSGSNPDQKTSSLDWGSHGFPQSIKKQILDNTLNIFQTASPIHE